MIPSYVQWNKKIPNSKWAHFNFFKSNTKIRLKLKPHDSFIRSMKRKNSKLQVSSFQFLQVEYENSFKITVNAGFEWRVRAPHAPSLGRHRSSHEKRSAQAADVRASGGGRRERERERGKIKEKEGKGRSTRIAFTRHEKQPEGEAKVAGNWNSNRGNPTDASPIPGVKLSL